MKSSLWHSIFSYRDLNFSKGCLSKDSWTKEQGIYLLDSLLQFISSFFPPQTQTILKLFNNFSLLLPDFVICFDTNSSLHCPAPGWFLFIGNVPHLRKNNKKKKFHSGYVQIHYILPVLWHFSNTAQWSASWWKLCPFFSLLPPPYSLPQSEIVMQVSIWASRTIFSCLHVLHTLLVFSIPSGQKEPLLYTTSSTANLQLETNKYHQKRNISENIIAALTVTIRKYLLRLKVFAQYH